MAPKFLNLKPKVEAKSEAFDEDDAILLSDYQLKIMKQLSGNPLSNQPSPITAKPDTSLVSKRSGNKEAKSTTRKEKAERNSSKDSRLESEKDQPGSSGVKAEPLPQNTMDTYLTLPDGPSSQHGDSLYRPMPLRSSKTDNHAAAEDSTAVVPRTTVDSSEMRSVEPPVSSADKGVAFLVEGTKEEAALFRINQEFFASAHPCRELLWFQIPRPQPTGRGLLEGLAPGNVGKLVVYKSGRTVLKFGHSELECAMEPTLRPGEGMAQYATVIDSQPSTEGLQCYQLGSVSRKVVCTP